MRERTRQNTDWALEEDLDRVLRRALTTPRNAVQQGSNRPPGTTGLRPVPPRTPLELELSAADVRLVEGIARG